MSTAILIMPFVIACAGLSIVLVLNDIKKELQKLNNKK